MIEQTRIGLNGHVDKYVDNPTPDNLRNGVQLSFRLLRSELAAIIVDQTANHFDLTSDEDLKRIRKHFESAARIVIEGIDYVDKLKDLADTDRELSTAVLRSCD